MVEWKKLGDLCIIRTGKLNANAQVENGIYPFFTCDAHPFRIDEYAFDTEAILISGNGSQVGHLNYYKGKFNAYQRTYVLDDFKKVDIFYVLHYLKGTIRSYVMGKSKKGSVPYITLPMLLEFLIPIPSHSEQQRIVSILDTFTSSISNLKQQIEERRKQYEYERDLLLDLEGKEGVEMKKLGEVANFVKDKIEASFLNSQNYVSVENLLKDKAGRIDSENVPFKGNWSCYKHGDVLIGNIRPYLRKIWLADRKGGTNGDVLIIRPNEFILPQFLYCVLASEKFFEYYNQTAKGGKMPRGEKSRALSYTIPLPPLSEQQRIVSILDTFEQSIANLEGQLALREKQYEYYRNQLLTFD